jgi:hypothetical protein
MTVRESHTKLFAPNFTFLRRDLPDGWGNSYLMALGLVE